MATVPKVEALFGKAVLDAAGRLLSPKAGRDALGLRAGEAPRIESRQDAIAIRREAMGSRLERIHGWWSSPAETLLRDLRPTVSMG